MKLDVVSDPAPILVKQRLESINLDTLSKPGMEGRPAPSENASRPLGRDATEVSSSGVPNARSALGRLLVPLSRISQEQQASTDSMRAAGGKSEPVALTEKRLSDAEAVASDAHAKVSDAQAEAVDARAESLERFKASEKHRDDVSCGDHEACAICLVEYEEGTCLRPLPCEHAFHTGDPPYHASTGVGPRNVFCFCLFVEKSSCDCRCCAVRSARAHAAFAIKRWLVAASFPCDVGV